MIKKSLISLGATLLVAATASAGLVLSETWSDGDRTNLDLPTSTAWYTSRPTDTLMATAADGGSMTQSMSAGSAHVIGYLTPAGTIDLAIGESIKLTFEVSFQNLSGNGNYFRFGLFDSTAVDPRIAVDNNWGGGYTGTRGFMVNVTALNQGAKVDLQRRFANNSNGTLIASTSAYFGNPVNLHDMLSESLVSDVIYTGTMVVTRSCDAENIVSASMTGPDGTIFNLGTWSETNANVAATGFDLVAFALNETDRDAFTLHSVTVQLIPEPSPKALLLLFIPLGAASKRRIRRSVMAATKQCSAGVAVTFPSPTP